MASSTASTATPPRHAFEQNLENVTLSKSWESLRTIVGKNQHKLVTLNHEQRTLAIRFQSTFYITDAGVKAHMEFSDLNAVIMDYLISEGYPSAAQKFAHEANIAPMLDVESIQERVEIREAIDAGDIQTAITKINELNPRILDKDSALHFSLLRLQLIELIRKATSTPDGDITAAITFATTHLAPRAPTKPEFLEDLERTMALLIFPPDNLAPPLAALLDPALRQEVAQQVNQALLLSQGERSKATLYDLVNHRSWAHQKALETKKDYVPEHLDLGFDTAQNGHETSQNGTSSSHQHNGQGDPMATSWGPY